MSTWMSASSRNVLALLALTGVLAFNAFAKPLYAWDLLAYVGVVHSYDTADAATLHTRTYADVRAHVPEDVYRALSGENGSRYKAAMAANPDYFVQQLPFYGVKPAYPALMYGLHKAGMGLVTAAYAIPRVAYFVTGLLLFVWLRRYRTTLFATVATALVVSLPFFASLPRYSSPDALSTLLVLATFFMLVEYRQIRVALTLAALAVTVRPDTILLAGLLAAYVMWREPEQRAAGLAGLAVALALYWVQVRISGNYGWATLLYHSMVEFLNEPATFVSPLTLTDYARIYYRAMSPELLFAGTASGSSYNIVLFLLLSLIALAGRYRSAGARDPWTAALAINLLFIAMHWVVLPGDKDRVIVSTGLVSIVAVIAFTGWRPDARASRSFPHTAPG